MGAEENNFVITENSARRISDTLNIKDTNEISNADIIKTKIIKLLSDIDDDSMLQEIPTFLEFKITQKINK